ncbi:MAG: beta-galactosidase [Clostridia bacterium]|nr:beta-galactosidase [Clostridia bacterium]
MIGLSYTSDYVLFDGAPTYLWSGDFPYYRLSPSEWEDRLVKVKQAGVRFITAYVPWNFHEYEEGKFDFTGKTGVDRRDLLRFIELVRDKGMYLIPKPGPFICAEVSHGGIPDWLTSAHPEIVMKDQFGRNVGFRQDAKPLPDYLNKVYMGYVRKWYKAFADAVSAYQYPCGPVVAVQIENEIPYSTSELANPFSWGYTAAVGGLYRGWVQQRYGSIADYNLLHTTKFGSYAEIAQPKERTWEFDSLRGWLAFQDWVAFKEWYGGRVLTEYGSMMRDCGIRAPLYHDAGMLENEAPMSFREASTAMWIGANFWLPVHPMYSLYSYAWAMRRLKELRGAQAARPSIAPELNWGWGNAREYDFLTRCTMPFLRGTNVYTIIDADNAGTIDGQVGSRTVSQKYSNNPEPYPGGAPIDAHGGLRPAYYSLIRLTRYTEREAKNLLAATSPSDIAMGFYTPYNYPKVYANWAKADDYCLQSAFTTTIGANEFLQSLTEGFIKLDMEYDAADLETASVEQLLEKKLLIVLSQEMMDSAVQDRLIEYVRRGGKLVLMPSMPEYDLAARGCTAISRHLLAGITVRGTRKCRMPEDVMWDGLGRPIKGSYIVNTLEIHEADEGSEYRVRARDEAGEPVAVERDYGLGKVIYIGAYCVDASLFSLLAKEEGCVDRYAYSNDPNVEVIPLVNQCTHDIYMFTVNRAKEPKNVCLSCVDAFDRGRLVQVDTVVDGLSCSILHLRDGAIVSASLNGRSSASSSSGASAGACPAPCTYAIIPAIGGIKLSEASQADFTWESASELRFSADRDTGVEIYLGQSAEGKSIRVYGPHDEAAQFEFASCTVRFHYDTNQGHADEYRIMMGD